MANYRPYKVKNSKGVVLFTVRPWQHENGKVRYDICYGDGDFAIYTATSDIQVQVYVDGYLQGMRDVYDTTKNRTAEGE